MATKIYKKLKDVIFLYNNKKAAAAYIRVSTEDQTEYSPAAQLKAIEDYASRNNMYIVNTYADEGISGRSAKKRPAFMEMVATAKKYKGKQNKPFEVILVHKFDRFSRNREESIVYKSMLRKECGIKVISITEHIEDDKFSVILEAMLEAMAEYYSLNLSDEVKKGMTEKAERGEYMTTAPFGYKWKNGRLVINEDEATYIKHIFESFANGTRNKSQLACELNDLGIKTHRGNKIELRTIDYILKNITYKGYTRWSPEGKKNYRIISNDNVIIKKGSHEPIISEELFEKAQDKLRLTAMTTRKRAKEVRKHWLTGIIKCSSCGASLSYIKSTNSLQCINYQHATCRISHSIIEKKAAAAIMKELNNIISANDLTDYIKFTTPSKDMSREQQLITKTVENLNNRLQRLKEAYLDGIIDLLEFKAEKTSITNQITEYGSQLQALTTQNFDPQKFKDKVRSISEIISNPSIADSEKNLALRQIFQKIIYDKSTESFDFYYYN